MFWPLWLEPLFQQVLEWLRVGRNSFGGLGLTILVLHLATNKGIYLLVGMRCLACDSLFRVEDSLSTLWLMGLDREFEKAWLLRLH